MPHEIIATFIPDSPIFDERERRSGLIDHLKDTNKPHQVMTLHKGDFTVSNRVGGEIKRIKKKKEYFDRNYTDLVSSLYDNRLYEEIGGLHELYDINILIIEKEEGATLFTPHFNADDWRSLRLSLEIGFDTHIFMTKNHKETVDLIYAFWEREKIGKHYVSPCNKTPRPKTLHQQQMYLLSGLLDVGDEKTQNLLDIFKNPYSVFSWIYNTTIEYTKSGNPKKIKDGISGFGPKFFIKNKELLTGDNENEKK